MKNWLWFLGVSIALIFSCGEKRVAEHSSTEAPTVTTVVRDTPPPTRFPSEPKGEERGSNGNQDTNRLLPTIHMGDKDYNPNLAKRTRAMEDSIRKAMMERNRVRDSIYKANHPLLPGDSVKSRPHR